MPRLGINIDHIATLRQARREALPDPVAAAAVCEQAGAAGITVHLREDRRHIQDHDVERLRRSVRSRLNLEMAVVASIADFACHILPDEVCLVPERRQELTTEGGLDAARGGPVLRATVERLSAAGIEVSVFIDPDEAQVRAAAAMGARCVELHTGSYARAALAGGDAAAGELARLYRAAERASGLGLIVNAGHGLDYDNAGAVSRIPEIATLNIGFAVIARAVMTGLESAVREMVAITGRVDRH